MANTVSIEDMPEVVHEPYAFLLDEKGVEPFVERSGYGKILLTHLGERTRMTIKFRLDGRKWRWEKSHLFIDGENVPPASGWDMYVSIFKDPDNGRRNHVPKGAKKAVIPASQEVDEQYLPTVIADSLKNMRRAAKATSVVTATVVSSANQYLLTVDDQDEGLNIVITFGYDGSAWTIADMMVINPAGYDITYQIEPDQFEALLLKALGAAGARDASSFIPLGGARGSAVTANPVSVRKSTVFRV